MLISNKSKGILLKKALALALLVGILTSSIDYVVQAYQVNVKTISGSSFLYGSSEVVGSHIIGSEIISGKLSTLSSSEATLTYSVANVNDSKSKIEYALANRLSSIKLNYTGTEIIPDYSNFLLNVVKTQISTAGHDYEKYLLHQYGYYATLTNTTQFTVTYSFNYLETVAQVAEVKAKVKEVLGQIITPNMTEGKRVKAINDYICKKLSYDTTLTNYTAYAGLLGNGKTVCQGYSLLAYRMLTDAGLEARIITGYANGGSHAWNMVKIAGIWYHLDATWDDPIPDRAGRVLETYLLISDAQIKPSHVWTSSLYPVASKSYNAATDVVIPKTSILLPQLVPKSIVPTATGAITVRNNVLGSRDTVTLSNSRFEKYALVTVYADATSSKILGSITINPTKATSVITTSSALSQAGGSVYVGVKSVGKTVSARLKIFYAQETAPTLTASQITVTNNISAKDTIKVSGLKKGALVRIYTSDGKKYLGQVYAQADNYALVTLGAKLAETSRQVRILATNGKSKTSTAFKSYVTTIKSASIIAKYMSISKGMLYVKGLSKGDIITVYNGKPGTKGVVAIARVQVKNGYSSLYAGFKTTNGYLYVTRTSLDKLQSSSVAIKNKLK